MPEKPYSNRELDRIHEDFGTDIKKILVQVTYTNGKLKKIIVAMLILFGIVIGQLFTGGEIVKILLGVAT